MPKFTLLGLCPGLQHIVRFVHSLYCSVCQRERVRELEGRESQDYNSFRSCNVCAGANSVFETVGCELGLTQD